MRRTAVVPALLTGLALTVMVAGPAEAKAKQTAADLSIKKTQLPGYSKEGSKAGKGPVTETSCGKKVTFIPKGATDDVVAFDKVRSRSTQADGIHIVEDEVVITTALTKDVATAKKTFLGVRVADKHCTHQDISDDLDGLQVHSTVKATSAPAIKHTDRGFTETATSNSSVTLQGKTLTISGVVQSLYYQRGRAITSITFTRSEIVEAADGSSISSITEVSNAATKAELKRIAKLSVAALGKQTAA